MKKVLTTLSDTGAISKDAGGIFTKLQPDTSRRRNKLLLKFALKLR